MKKLIFGLIATVVLGFVGNAQTKSIYFQDNDLLADNDLSYLNLNVDDNLREKDLLRPKNAWYYAGVDAAGGFGGFKAGAATGHPLLMSAGLVFGAIGASAWDFYWSNRIAPIKLNTPKDPFAKTFTNDSEKGGYLHNSFMINFINENQVTFESTRGFVDKIYDPLCSEISNEYKIDLETLMKSFPKENMIKNLEKFNNLHSTHDEEEIVNILGNIVEETTGSSILSRYYMDVLNALKFEEADLRFQIESFINKEKLKSVKDTDLTSYEKTFFLNSLNILKYSYSLWSNN